MEIRRFNVATSLNIATAVIHGRIVYLSGLGPDDLTQDTAGQAKQIFARIDAILAEHGTSKDRLLTALAWLRDVETFPEWAAAWKEWIGPEHAPARATVGAPLGNPSMRVEVMVTAAL